MFLSEYLNFDERQTNWNNNTTTPTAQWCNVQVKRYKLDGTTYTLLDTTTYKAFDGFGYYEQGYNPTLSYDILHDEGTFFYAYDANVDPSTNTDYRSNFITVATTSTAVSARWTNLNTGATQVQSISNSSVIDVRKVHQSYYADGNKLEIYYVLSGVVLYTGYFEPYLNCKYTPIVCDFVNKYGGWQRTWFFGASNDTLSVEKTDYNLMQGTFPNYSTTFFRIDRIAHFFFIIKEISWSVCVVDVVKKHLVINWATIIILQVNVGSLMLVVHIWRVWES